VTGVQTCALPILKRLADEGMTMMIVTHEMGFAREVGTRVIFMDDGQIREDGPPSRVFTNPTHPRCKDFLAHVL
jgi:ABC-type histidine transport system ATPase subunit